jgi:hypothetical protein
MGETFQLYVKNTSNCEGLPLQTFERLGPEWEGESLMLPFGEGGGQQTFKVVGWTDLFTGRPCEVHVARVRWLASPQPGITGGPAEDTEGYLVWGGNSGVRILDDDTEPTPGVDEHLPPGYGRPIVWVALEDVGDLPDEVRAVVEALMAKAESFRTDERCTLYVVPVTLRQVEAAGIELNSNFGIDEAEHAELLDDPTILRAVFGVALDEVEGEWCVHDYHALDTYCAHLDGKGPRWENAMQTYYSAEGHKDRANALSNLRRLEGLVINVVGTEEVQRLLGEARRPFEEWLAENAADV